VLLRVALVFGFELERFGKNYVPPRPKPPGQPRKSAGKRRRAGKPKWRRYQEETAGLFRELGCSVETDVSEQGARSKHDLDVSVRFTRFGLKQHWIVECKLWNRRVPKKEVLTLKSITEDLGADRGILIAERGHQSGAYEAARLTNITLTTLAELKEAARGELLALGLSAVRRREIAIRRDMQSLYDKVRLKKGERPPFPGWTKVEHKPETDGRVLSKISMTTALIESGAQKAEFGAFPIRLLRYFDENDDVIQSNDFRISDDAVAIRSNCKNLEEFVVTASNLLDILDRILRKQKMRAAEARRLKSRSRRPPAPTTSS
jgi:hypothetical protein